MAGSYALKSDKIGKSFRIYEKKPGFWGSIQSFFHREHRENWALRDLDLCIEPGEFVGLLGENGAGKTTFMKLATGIIPASAGTLEVLGHTPFDRPRDFRKRIALVMGQKSQLWWDLPALDSLQLLKRFYELSESDFQGRLAELSELLDTDHVLKIPLRKLSLGERMKLELMACLLHSPDFVFLDEPTIGLDIVAQRRIRQFLRDYQKKRGITMILTSHYMADIEALCERVVLLIKGQKRFDGSRRDFARILGDDKLLHFAFERPAERQDPLFTEHSPEWNDAGTYVELRVPTGSMGRIAAEILGRYPVSDFGSEKLPIERVMRRILESPEILGLEPKVESRGRA